jgi:DNA-binding LacI/PurR family transcriptional regulator
MNGRQDVSDRSRTPTSHDVAARAGVSQATVSRALRDCPSVALETRARVKAAANELDYRLNRAAARLRGSRSNTIAVVLLSAPGASRASLNPFYYDLVGAIEAEAARRNLNVLLSFQGEPDTQRCDFEERGEADGVIVIGSASNRQAWDYFIAAWRAGCHIVGWGAPDDALPTIRADNHLGAMLAVDHLVERQRARIAFAGPGWQDHHAYRMRRTGYHAALRQHGLDPIEVDICAHGSRFDQGAATIAALHAAGLTFDAVFAASDGLALGVVNGVRELGLSVPSDVAVIGFDGAWQGRESDPALTTIEQDTTRAAVMLVEAISTGMTERANFVPVRIAARAST